jgi:YgiT-type zinc finger domain-containing protein
MRSAKVKTAIWREEQLFLVEEIPAQVCDWCIEQFYDEATTDALRRLTEDGFSSLAPKREVLVPVFSLEEQIRKGAATEEETHADY